MKEENKRLQEVIDRISNDYYELQMRLADIQQQGQPKVIILHLSSLPSNQKILMIQLLRAYVFRSIEFRFRSEGGASKSR